MRCLDKTHLAPCQLPRGACFRQDRRAGSGLRRGAGRNGAGFADGLDFDLYGLQNFSAANSLLSATNGGELGVSTGFGSGILFRLDALTAANRYLFSSYGVSSGWLILLESGIAGRLYVKTGVGSAQVGAPTRTFVASDVGKIFLLIGRQTGASNLIEMLADRAASQGTAALATYGVSSGNASIVGANASGASTADGVTVLGTLGFRGTPSTAQFQAYYDAARVLGDLPDTMQGATVTHLWSLKRELVGVSNPAGRKTYGARNLSAANYLRTADPGGIAGVATGFFVSLQVKLDSITGQNRVLASRSMAIAGNFTGWYFLVDVNGVLNFVARNGGATPSTSYQLIASDIGQPMMITGVLTAGTVLQLYVNGTKIGADSASLGGFTPFAGPMTLGSNRGLSVTTTSTELVGANSAGLDVIAVQGAHAVPTQPELAAQFQSMLTTGRIQPIPGKNDHYYDVTHDVVSEASGVPATVLDLAGTDHLTRYTFGVQTDANAIRAVGPYGPNDSWQTALGGGIQGAAGGFHVIVDVWLWQVPSLEMIVMCTPAAADKGWYMNTSTGGRVSFVGAPGSVTPSPGYLFTAGDLNKRLRFLIHRTAGGVNQLWLNGTQIGPDLSAAWVAPVSTAMTIGNYFGAQNFKSGYVEAVVGGNSALTGGEITSVFADLTTAPPTVAGKSTKRYIVEQDVAAMSGALPIKLVERISGNDDMIRSGGPIELSIATATAPPCPAQLTDRITGASADALARVGSPTVKIIDPTIDGRRTLGAQGFSAANYLQCVNGLAGALTGHWISWFGVINSTPSGVGILVGKRNSAAGQQGFSLLVNATGIYFEQVNAGASAIPNVTTALTAAMLGQPKVITGVFTGTAGSPQNVIQLYVDGVAFGGNVTCVGLAPASVPYRLGLLGDGTQIGNTLSAYGDAGGLGVPTLAQVQDHAAATLATGRMQSIAGITSILHDLTTDILASGVDAVPATVLDRVGTDHLTNVGIAVQTDANAIRGVGPYGAADVWQAAPGGAIPGASAGFNVVMDLWFTKIPTTAEVMAGSQSGGGTDGWAIQCASATFRILVNGSVGGGYTVTSADLNKRTRVVLNFTGNGGVARMYVNGTQYGSDLAIATLSLLATAKFQLGSYQGSQNFSSGYIELCQGGPGVLTLGEIATLNADLTQAAPVVAGKTPKRYVFEADIAAVSGALPSRSVERISGGDDLVRAGSPLTLAQRTERVWSYETSPIMYGGQSWTDSDYYSGGGFVPDVTGYWISILLVVLSQATSGTRMLVAKGTSLVGMDIRTNGLNSTIQLVHRTNGAGSVVTGTSGSILASDVGKVHLFTGAYDPGIAKVRSFWKRAELTQQAATAFAIDNVSAFTLGRYNLSAPGFSASNVAILAVAGGNAILSPAEHFAQYDACMAMERMIEVPGKTDFLVDFTQEKSLPATLIDRKSGNNMTRTGNPALMSLNARTWGV